MENYLFNKFYALYIIGIVLLFGSCKKFLELDPPIDKLNSNLVFDQDKSALAALNGIYSQMMESPNKAFCSSLTLLEGQYADELYHYNTQTGREFELNNLTPQTLDINLQLWQPVYTYIYAANACLEGVSTSNKLTASTRRMIVGEAKFLRALGYWYLVNIFGKVPLITTTDYQVNTVAGRADSIAIYEQIFSDLNAAKDSLDVTYAATERARPNKYAAMALLARVYLYRGDWAAAERMASSVIASGIYEISSIPLGQVFLKESRETIWQLRPVNPALNTYEGNIILPANANTAPSYLLRKELYQSFEKNDQRREMWIGKRTYQGEELYYPAKYKVRGQSGIPQTEYYVVLRLAEQYLIRSEARARQADQTGAVTDLNVIRQRAGLPVFSGTDAALLTAIENERKFELMAEWGHRWFDLKRNNRVDAVIGSLKPTWTPKAILWPIPESEILINPNLLPQNAGY